MNKFIFSGRLTGDPETKQVKDMTVTTFSIAVKRGFTKEVDYFNITTWKGVAENCAKYVSKGSKVLCEGRVQTRSYENKEGKKVYVTDYVADNVEFEFAKREEKQEVPDDDLPF